jgi:hypothetical protein
MGAFCRKNGKWAFGFKSRDSSVGIALGYGLEDLSCRV